MFVFSLARELHKTVSEIENTMDAAELMEWAAYFKATNEKSAAELQQQIYNEKSDEERFKDLRSFLSCLGGKK